MPRLPSQIQSSSACTNCSCRNLASSLGSEPAEQLMRKKINTYQERKNGGKDEKAIMEEKKRMNERREG